MIDYWRIHLGDDWVDALCGGCNNFVELIWNEEFGDYVLPERCLKCDWVPTKINPGEN